MGQYFSAEPVGRWKIQLGPALILPNADRQVPMRFEGYHEMQSQIWGLFWQLINVNTRGNINEAYYNGSENFDPRVETLAAND